MASTYTINSTTPTVYSDPVSGVVNGVLVRFTIDDFNEVHEVRVPRMDVNLVKSEIEKIVAQREELASLGHE